MMTPWDVKSGNICSTLNFNRCTLLYKRTYRCHVNAIAGANVNFALWQIQTDYIKIQRTSFWFSPAPAPYAEYEICLLRYCLPTYCIDEMCWHILSTSRMTTFISLKTVMIKFWFSANKIPSRNQKLVQSILHASIECGKKSIAKNIIEFYL